MCPSDLAPRRTLQELLGSLRDLEATLEANGGEIEPGSALEAAWEATDVAVHEKVDAVAFHIDGVDARADHLKDAADRLYERSKALRNHAERMRAYMDRCIGPDRDALEGDTWKIVRRKNGGRVPVEVFDEGAVAETCPEALVPQPPKIDKEALRAALERGSAVQGARLMERGTRIVIAPR